MTPLCIDQPCCCQQENAHTPRPIIAPSRFAELLADLARLARRLAQMEREAKNLPPAGSFSGPEAGR